MAKLSVILIFFLLFFQQCQTPSVNLVGSQDPDIILVNIEEGDRSFIGRVLLKLDSLNPILIGIDVFFKGRKKQSDDSVLIDALKKIKNDVLAYGFNKDKTFEYSESIFTKLVKDQGFLNYERTFGLISNMTPLQKIENHIHESFALKVINHWKPAFKHDIKVNEEISINYTRPLEKFLTLDGSFLLETNIDNFDLSNKIFLVGYIGPGKEDKYSTPLRLVGKEYERSEPDTYGLVIIANQIRTILEHHK